VLTAFRTRVRRYLGTDVIPRLEALMANEILTLLNGLVNQTTEASAAQQASFLNLHNGLTRQEQAIRELTAQLAAAVEGNGKVTPEMQEVATRLSESLADIKKAAQTADDGFEPVEEPTEPTDPGTEVPPVDVPPVDVPVEPTPDVPVTDQPAPVDEVPAAEARSKR
jgi:regulator of replication initiation timing